MIEEIKAALSASAQFTTLVGQLTETAAAPVRVTGVPGSMAALLVGALHDYLAAPIVMIADDREEANCIHDDLLVTQPPGTVAFFAGDHSHGSDPSRDASDVQALRAVATGQSGILVTHSLALRLQVPSPDFVRSSVLTVEVGTEFPLGELRTRLSTFGFSQKDFVEVQGDFAVRGGIVDVFPFTGDQPVRIEFYGDTLESIRQFDALSQRSLKELSTAVIVPDLYAPPAADDLAVESTTLTSYFQKGTVVVIEEPGLVRASLDQHSLQSSATPSSEEVFATLNSYPSIHLQSIAEGSAGTVIDFGGIHQPAVNGSIRLFHEQLLKKIADGYRIIITGDGQGELSRLKELLSSVTTDLDDRGESEHGSLQVEQIEFSLEALHGGFIIPDLRTALYTEHQLFGRVKRHGRKRTARFRGFSPKELQQLRPGDYVVHRDYGIGRFIGLRKIRVRNAEQEVVSVQYEAKDTLYVNLNYINRLQKYASKEGHEPRLSRLGSNEWDRLKTRVKTRVKDIARELISLYARRKRMEGFAFREDTPWQRELEASFMYEDTYDQAKATRDVKEDMQTPNPMDRLICGDVGFGKTEIAVRAAFKAVADGKQVAILVPTTILAMQHYNTFADRVGKYAVNLQVLSRFKQRKQQLQILSDLKAGLVDIVIGTHRLLSKDVAFKDLGLLVIDEEHRFGVAAKEKLRMLRAEVDTLALTATPIPRTLHFSLMGARDLSIIATPPRNRLPIVTEIVQWNDDIIREAILREVHRGGQVYFVHDRINTIGDITDRLTELVPGIRLRSVHGQMEARVLEEVMVEFLERKLDMLVATKIIESGLDIPSVNTIIVNRADRFGMAELYQLRGRVGRSNVQAYAYLVTPPIAILPRVTLRRLQALEEFNELGSGFNLAMRDLEIRGAGNLLGSEQSGFIETMGFETYTRILEETVQELKDEEFRELFKDEVPHVRKRDVIVEADVDALIPDSYLGNGTERMAMYRRLYGLVSEEQLREISDELRDRFGVLPPEVELLLGVIRIRLVGAQLGFVRVMINSTLVEAEFPEESDKAFYDSPEFQALMTAISRGSEH